MNTSLLACALGLVVTLTGCTGYSLGNQKPAHLSHVTKLAVPTFENQTLEPRLGSLVTNAIIKQIQNSGGYEIVSIDDAEAVLDGRVVNVSRSQFRADRDNVLRTSQLLMTLRVDYEIKDAGSSSIIHRGRASADSYTILDSNIQNSEAQALEDAAQRLSVNVASDITEGW
ncbi:lipopolysaccharide assembly protein [Prosthecobacter fusiformis]|uniref:Lipopolysaccharide assembly protein n=1 Tax=Prosthecobacter fusiformis TaxID=48464 RepID=A0A4R7RKM9_9BACT|nr:LptE family protein [Prosthecobacter fusiformis]TDU64659.1 lipopolysaccharide assembly protein [Prosthecobacter fusiformis]